MGTNTHQSRTVSDAGRTATAFSCPCCRTTAIRQHGTFQCSGCGYAPSHGAD